MADFFNLRVPKRSAVCSIIGCHLGVRPMTIMSVIATFLALCIMKATVCNAETHAGDLDRRLMKDDSSCAIPVCTQSGWVCGAERASYSGAAYASFRGVPYARQPLGDLRFVAPQPVEPWDGYYDASIEGPVCVQTNTYYRSMLQPVSMGEDCLRVNVHVPAGALPARGAACSGAACLPVLVFVHGGGSQTGSGDSDINGPEYMMDRNIILVTINYRLGPFGFLWLNSSSVPGNTGLRDQVAALRWVQANARAFGGDPGRVTLMGQSAGGTAVHILSLSEATRGLFTKVILMSGTAVSGFYSSSQSYLQNVKNAFLKFLGINSTDVEEIHRRLIELPGEAILHANDRLLELTGLYAFNSAVESKFDGVTRILDRDPDTLVALGRGSGYPLMVGFTNVECDSMRPRFEDIDVLTRIHRDPTFILPIKLIYSTSYEERVTATERMMKKYFKGTPTLGEFIVACSDSLYIYASLKLAQTRVATGGAPIYSYQFSYSSDFVPVKLTFGLNYTGAAHLDDLSYVLRVNSILRNTTLNVGDGDVKDWMTTLISNFVRCSNPTCSACDAAWPAAARPLRYQDIRGAAYALSGLTAHQQTMIRLFDSFYKL